MKFELRKVPELFLENAPWVFESKVELDITPEVGWQIICDDAAFEHWHPKVSNVEWYDEAKSGRIVDFKDTLFTILLAGPLKVWENFVWETEGPVKKFSFYFTHMNRPNDLTYNAGCELFQIEPIEGDPNKCIFTRKMALEPGTIARYVVGPVVYPHLKKIFTEMCPECIVKAITEKKLPVVSSESKE